MSPPAYAQANDGAKYGGVKVCAGCHQTQAQRWETSHHALAMEQGRFFRGRGVRSSHSPRHMAGSGAMAGLACHSEAGPGGRVLSLPVGSDYVTIRKNLPPIVNQIFQTMRCDVEGRSIDGRLIPSRGLGALRFQYFVNLVLDSA